MCCIHKLNALGFYFVAILDSILHPLLLQLNASQVIQ
jgi:hypothetical protein